jgi:threonine dehydrogenase-like Zn-dependent dehydrogenase
LKALLLRDYNQLDYTDVPLPALAPDEVLVRVKACGICGSDVHGVDGSTGRRVPPIIMGHEASGVVEQVGAAVAGWQPGDRVTFDITVHCGSCYFCRRGMINLCEQRRIVGVSTPEFRMHGAFAEYVAIPHRILYRLPDSLSYERAALIEAVSVAAHAVHRTPLVLHDTAVVIGVGMIGLLLVQLLRRAGCGQIIAVDVQPERLQRALRLGADVALRSDRDDVPTEVRRRTAMDVSKEMMLEMYRRMVRIREFELAAIDLFKRGMVKGAVHTYIGQEASGVGVCMALRRDDLIAGTHRSHGHNIAKGADTRRMMAEILGKETGYCKGVAAQCTSPPSRPAAWARSAVVGARHSDRRRRRVGLQDARRGPCGRALHRRCRLQHRQLARGLNLAAVWDCRSCSCWRTTTMGSPPISQLTAAKSGSCQCVLNPTASPACAWTASTCWRCTRRL